MDDKMVNEIAGQIYMKPAKFEDQLPYRMGKNQHESYIFSKNKANHPE